jgi:hypothetical protein
LERRGKQSETPKRQVIVISSVVPLGQAKRLREGGIFYQGMKPVDLEEIRSAVECTCEKIERENLKEGFSF